MRKVEQIVKQNGEISRSRSRRRHSLEVGIGAGEQIRTADVLLGKQAF
jgi:hypothetical protein